MKNYLARILVFTFLTIPLVLAASENDYSIKQVKSLKNGITLKSTMDRTIIAKHMNQQAISLLRPKLPLLLSQIPGK